MGQFTDLVERDATLVEDEVSRRFARRHSLGLWCAVIPTFGFIVSFFIPMNGTVLPVIVAFIFGIALLAYIHFIYRCPRCGTVPSSSVPGTTGILFFPKRCPKCKAPLLPTHRWGQD